MSLALNRRGFLAGAAALACTRTTAASEPIAPFRRGASIHNLMNWASLDPADKLTYSWPPFAAEAHRLQPAILDNMKQAGFDFIRLTLDPGVFLQITGTRRQELDAMLVGNVRRLLGLGFGVVVDFHPNWQVPTYAPEKITASVDGPLFKAYAAMLVQTAQLLGEFKGERVALELMNEPQWGWDSSTTARWQQMLQLWHASVRRVAPDLTLILSGARGGNKDGLLAVDPTPFKGSNVLWSFHYYTPYLLTHQGVKADDEGAKLWRHFADLPYPAVPEHYEDVWKLIRRNIEADKDISAANRPVLLSEARKKLVEYLETRPGRAMVAKDFAEVEAWARQHDIAPQRIFLGEFGITRSYGRYRASPPQPLENWLTDVRSEAEARGFGWSLWVVSGYGGMSLIETDESALLDKPTLLGLGLTLR